MPVILALEAEAEGPAGYILSLRPGWATGDPVSDSNSLIVF